jgi:hypothetical protein
VNRPWRNEFKSSLFISGREPDLAALIQWKSGVMRDFPQVAVGVGKISAIAAPERALRGLHDFAASAGGGLQNFFDGAFFFDIEGERDARKSPRRIRYARVFRKVASPEERKHDATGVEKSDAFRFANATLHAERRVKTRGTIDIGNAEGNESSS